ncbi:MAG: restriction endonuclease subunit R, partial [Coprothermobacterota bacterium]|nr:restriction endonuclease subunit R [Coprothermobacterota bacterium]
NESPIDPAYYEQMSKLLDALIEQRRKGVIEYAKYLEEIAELTRQAKTPGGIGDVPSTIDTPSKRALFNNLSKNEELALRIDQAVLKNCQDGWRDSPMKTKLVRYAIRGELTQALRDPQSADPYGTYNGASDDGVEDEATRILELVKRQNDY